MQAIMECAPKHAFTTKEFFTAAKQYRDRKRLAALRICQAPNPALHVQEEVRVIECPRCGDDLLG